MHTAFVKHMVQRGCMELHFTVQLVAPSLAYGKCSDFVLRTLWDPSPVRLLTPWSLRPPATSINCVSRLEGYRERLVFAKEARLVLISRGVWDPSIDPRGKKASRFHTAVHGDRLEPTAAYCHHSPKRKDSKLPCQEQRLCPSSSLLIWKEQQRVYMLQLNTRYNIPTKRFHVGVCVGVCFKTFQLQQFELE